MKKKYIIGMAMGILLSGCANASDARPTDSYSKFTMPGTNVETMEGEVPFANFTIDVSDLLSSAVDTETQPAETQIIELPTEPSTEELSIDNPSDAKYTVVLDPGHGGVFQGANYNGYEEKRLSLEVALKTQNYLLEHYKDVAVYLTRTTDKELSIEQKTDLEKRVLMAVEKKANIFVSLHFNSDGNLHNSTGALICASKQPWVKDNSERLGNLILEQLCSLGLTNGGVMLRDSDTYFDENGVPMDYYAINRYAASNGLVGIIVEHAFMDNPSEVVFFGSDAATTALAKADAVGIANYLGLELK